MEIIILDIDPSDSGKYYGYSGKIYFKFFPDTGEVQLWTTLIHLESGAAITRCYPLPHYFGLLYVEELRKVRMEQITGKKRTTKRSS